MSTAGDERSSLRTREGVTEEEVLAWAENEARLWAYDRAELVVETLKRRGIHVSDMHHKFITSCTYPSTLEFWHRRADSAYSIDEVTEGIRLDIPSSHTFRSKFAQLYVRHGWVLAWEGGRAEGSIQTEGKAILQVLAARGISVSRRDRLRIAACNSRAWLATWLKRAATAETADQVFP